MKWIDATKNLPEMDGKEYLVFRAGFTGSNADKNGYELLTAQRQASWYGWRWVGDRPPLEFGVTHWMKLPPAPTTSTCEIEAHGRKKEF